MTADEAMATATLWRCFLSDATDYGMLCNISWHIYVSGDKNNEVLFWSWKSQVKHAYLQSEPNLLIQMSRSVAHLKK